LKKITQKPMRLNLQRFDEGGEAPATVEAITEALTGLEGGAAYVAGLNQLIASDRKGKSDIAKLNARVAKLTGSEKTLLTERDAAIQKFNRLLDFNGIPADTEDLETALETLKEAQKAKDGGMDTAKLQSQINDLTRGRAALEKERDEQKKIAEERLGRIHTIIRDAAVERALKASGALEYEALVPIFRDKVKILDDETPVYPTEDGTDVTVEEGVKMFFEKHPRLLANNQNAGGGSGGSPGGKVDFGKMSQSEYEKLRKEGKI
jgi:hypothetical protein